MDKDNIKNALDIIKKHGDLYDLISSKKNVNPENTAKKMINIHTLLFSRILYLALISSTHIKNKLVPLKKVKNAQDEIRKYLGIPVDIIRTKDKKKELSLIYGNYISVEDNENYYEIEISKNIFIDHLHKILDFCNKYHMEKVYIKNIYLYQFLGKSNEKYHMTSYNIVIKNDDTIHYYHNYTLAILNIKELEEIIIKLEETNIDRNYIYSFADKIQDITVVNAINDYKRDDDLDKLLNTVKNRLVLNFNSDSTSKNKIYGKIYEQVELYDKYIKSLICDNKGNIISSSIITIYDYLEIPDYQSLKNSINDCNDERERKLMSLLYLYLINEEPLNDYKNNTQKSFYDYIYNNYKNLPSWKHIPGVRTKVEKLKLESRSILTAISSVSMAYILATLLSLIPSEINNHEVAIKKPIESVKESILNAYIQSYNFEKNIIEKFKQQIEEMLNIDDQDDITSSSQKAMDNSNKLYENRVAEIEWFSKEKMPIYFVDSYYRYGYFDEDKLSYSHRYEFVNIYLIEDVRPLFQIKTPISLEDLHNSFNNNTISFPPLELYPAGDDYVLTKIYIIDELDPTKVLTIGSERNYDSTLTNEELKTLYSIEQPMIYYIYGLSNENNLISESPTRFNDSDYNDIDFEKTKEAVLKGLELNNDATREEIIEAITKKEYTKHPLDNFGNISPTEYFEKTAKLDSINAEIALTLAVASSDDLIFTLGYYNENQDNEITIDEAYMWAMSEDGEVVDVLSNYTKENNEDYELKVEEKNWLDYNDNSESSWIEHDKPPWTMNDNLEKEEESFQDKAKELLDILIRNNIPYYIAVLLTCLIIYKLFGKKVKFTLKLKNANKILSDEDIDKTYANLKKVIYGGINIPIKRDKKETIEAITNEIVKLSKEEIKLYLQELSTNNNFNSESTKKIKELLINIPFIIDNQKKLIEEPKKKLILGDRHEK